MGMVSIMQGIYQTKQKEAVLTCLAMQPGKALTVKELYDACSRTGAQVGISTIYRQLKALIGENKVKRMVPDDNSGIRFQYLEQHCQQDDFFLKCEHCGKMTPVDCDLLETMMAHMNEQHGFRIDAARSVLYGQCAECK